LYIFNIFRKAIGTPIVINHLIIRGSEPKKSSRIWSWPRPKISQRAVSISVRRGERI